jgi:hypothetical protein
MSECWPHLASPEEMNSSMTDWAPLTKSPNCASHRTRRAGRTVGYSPGPPDGNGLVVGEELVPRRVDRGWVVEEQLVHLLDEPQVRPEGAGGAGEVAGGHGTTAFGR